MSNKIFISHSSKDLNIVKLFVESILKLGLEIPSSRIFCSSMEGHGVKSGEYIPDRLKVEVNKSSIAILFISENYKNSEVCLNELGAAWVSLDKTQIIPFLLPNVSFDKLGFLDVSRLGLRITELTDLFKLIQDNRKELNPDFDLQLVNTHINEFLKKLNVEKSNDDSSKNKQSLEANEWEDCFTNNLYPFSELLRKSLPTYPLGVHEVLNDKLKSSLLTSLSKSSFLKSLWYKFAEGDGNVDSLNKLPTGNWLIANHWEVKIEDVWVNVSPEYQNNFILLKLAELPPFQYQSDVGGQGHYAGILNDGTIVSDTEDSNGYAIINSETIKLSDFETQTRYRDDSANWLFLGSDYHKIGYYADETINFCKLLDDNSIEVSESSLKKFIRQLSNHPTVLMYR